VPFVQLLAPARRAFAAAGGWMPRIETTRTLAATLGPPPRRGAGELGWGALTTRCWRRSSSRASAGPPTGRAATRAALSQSAARAVATAQQLMNAAAAVAPEDRTDWWAEARTLLQPPAGPGGTERLLPMVALEWAAASTPPATDRLFALRPAPGSR
jgi:ATP-dependent helicase/nuclease subunit B